MKIHTSLKCLGLLLILMMAAPLSAAPKVVVSLAPLHSLVSSIMEGVAEPTLLLKQDEAYETAMDAFQKSHLLTADMLIWSGSGLETSIGQTIKQIPALKQKLITLTNYVPLLGGSKVSGPVESRQLSRELTFWNDPRLAIMAVRMITPRLVRLDPDHQEHYLDNEIRLLKQLKGLESEIADNLSMYDAVSKDAIARVDPYFSHRFIAPSVIQMHEADYMHRVSVTGSNNCAKQQDRMNGIKPGPALYFETMRLAADSLASCMQRLSGETLAENIDKQSQ